MKIIKKLFGIIISIFFLYLALRKLEWQKIPPILATIKTSYISFVVLSLTGEFITRGYRWKILLGKNSISFRSCYFGWIFGMLFNNIFPARAGELVRSYYLGKKNNIPISKVIGSVVLERFLDGIIILSFIAYSFSSFKVDSNLRIAGYSALTFYLSVCFFLVFLQFKKNWIDLIIKTIFSRLPLLETKINSIKDSFIQGSSLITNPQQLLLALIISLITWTQSVLTYWLGLKMFFVDIGVNEALLLISVLSIGAMLPSSPGMIGIYEYCFVLSLSKVLGYSQELAITAGIFIHAIAYTYILVIGLLFLSLEKISVKELASPNDQFTQ